jgi:ATP-dependent DNA helicase RecQ
MIDYVETTGSRMKFLCDYLGDSHDHEFANCDNTGEKRITVNVTTEWVQKLNDFKDTYFPVLEVQGKGSKIVNGVAASYYGFSNTGAAIHRCKYENGGDFPDFLLSSTLRAFRKRFGGEMFDMVVYVPPTSSGDLVRNFATKFAQALNLPVSHNLVKARQTKEQKIFENGVLKAENVAGAFTFVGHEDLSGKSILLIDDIFDSGATIKEVGRILTNFGVVKIAPIVIAKTVGGDIV